MIVACTNHACMLPCHPQLVWHTYTGKGLTVADLVKGLGKSGVKLGAVRKQLDKLTRTGAPVQPALPGPIQARQRRKAG